MLNFLVVQRPLTKCIPQRKYAELNTLTQTFRSRENTVIGRCTSKLTWTSSDNFAKRKALHQTKKLFSRFSTRPVTDTKNLDPTRSSRCNPWTVLTCNTVVFLLFILLLTMWSLSSTHQFSTSASASLHEATNYNNWPSIFWRPFL